jgi:putative Ca2+/H+ antiporter (TMEM165/GDT1 family)
VVAVAECSVVTDIITAIASAFGVVFLAELGDKTQLIALGFGARYQLRTVVAGLLVGFAVAGALAAAVGGMLGATLPERPLAFAAGVLFLYFAAKTWRDSDRDGDDDDMHAIAVRSVIASIALTIAAGELGDKTQLTTAALAAQSNPVAVWVGATAGEVCAASLGAIVGSRIGTRINPTLLRFASALLFTVFGLALIIRAL